MIVNYKDLMQHFFLTDYSPNSDGVKVNAFSLASDYSGFLTTKGGGVNNVFSNLFGILGLLELDYTVL